MVRWRECVDGVCVSSGGNVCVGVRWRECVCEISREIIIESG